MEQPIPIDEVHNLKTIPLCQVCLEKVAIKICHQCGCPLCLECFKKHICNKKGDKGDLTN